MKRALLFFFQALLLIAWAEQGQADVLLVLEGPAQNQILTGITGLSGWTFSTVPGAQVTLEATIDGQTIINGLKVSEVLCCTVREDIAEAYPTMPQARLSGFALVFNVNYLSEGTHLLVVRAHDGVSSVDQQESRTFSVVKPGGFTFLSQLLIDKDTKVALSTDKKTVLVTNAVATDNDTGSSQAVNLQLGWQEASQSFGVVSAQNVGKPTAGGDGEEGSGDDDVDEDDPTKPPIALTIENPPTTTSTRGGFGPISGWTFTRSPNATISTVRYRLDDIFQSDLPCCAERPDVQEEFTNRPQALDSGFGILTNFNQLTTGVHNFGIEVQDSAGVTQSAVASTTVVKVANSEALDMFDLSTAQASRNDSAIELENVTVRDKTTQQTTQVTVDYIWDEGCQCFTPQVGCGNGSLDSGEECDGATLNGETCASLGLPGGTLACRPRCAANDKKCTFPCFFELHGTCTGGPLIYVTNVSSNSVSVIDTLAEDKKEVVATIRVGNEPRGIAATPDGKTVYVANFADSTVSVINTATNTVTATLKLGKKKGPVGITMSPDGALAYVVNGLKKAISIIDTTTNTVLKKTIGVGKKPQYLVLSADGTQGYVTNFGNNSVSFLDMNRRKKLKNVIVGQGPNGLALSPDGSLLYVVNFNSDTLSVVDTATRKVVKTVTVGSQPTKVMLSQDGAQAYVSNSASSTISIFNTFDFSSAGSLTVSADNRTDSEPDSTLLTLAEKRLYVTLFGNGLGSVIGVFSTATDAPLKTIKVGLGPFSMVAIPGH